MHFQFLSDWQPTDSPKRKSQDVEGEEDPDSDIPDEEEDYDDGDQRRDPSRGGRNREEGDRSGRKNKGRSNGKRGMQPVCLFNQIHVSCTPSC